MSRILLGALLTLGLCFTACESAAGQEHRGWPEEGSLHWSAPQAASPATSAAPSVGSAEHHGWPPEGALNWSPEQSFSANPRSAAPDWRDVFHTGRWWYWMPNSSWMNWDHGGWQNFAAAGVSR